MVKEIKTPTSIMHHIFVGDLAGCGMIRCVFPSMVLSQYNHNNRIRFYPSYGMHFINDPQYYKSLFFIMFQRSATTDQLELIKHFRKNFREKTKTPILYEIDDLLTDIPEWNFANAYYKKYSNTAIEIMKQMDGMIVSTNKLKEVYSQYQSNIEVVKNHLVKGFWGEPTYISKKNKKPRILWAGSGNHFSQDKDIKGGDFGNKLIDFIIKTKDKYQWVIIGGMPLELKSINEIEYYKWINIMEYSNVIKSLNIDLAIAPLEQNLFNECKSNIKALEYTAAGIPAVYSDIEPYKNLTLTSKTDEQMIHLIESHLENFDSLESVWLSDYKKLKDQLFWDDTNIVKYYNKLVGFFGLRLPK